ncbi:hypothetical protein DVH05_019487 [Phytophthora capsici]|nr:hypothetical protein DVH05_019487 [Phytophthora capsici]
MWKQPEEDGETVSSGTVAEDGAERPERVKKVEKHVAVTSREVGTVTRNAVPGRTECTDGTDLVPGGATGTVTETTGTVKEDPEVVELPVSARGYLLVTADGSPLRMGRRRAPSELLTINCADEDQGTVDATTTEPERTLSNRAEATDVECLFTDAELDAMEACELGQEATVLAGTDVRPEPEEYDKELEDRLYPLKDGEIMDRVKANAEAAKEPSTEELSLHLGIPVEVLERTRHASPDGSDDPERWRDWYSDTLQKSEEAKRANRDFRTPVVNVVDGTVMKDRRMSPPDETAATTCSGSDAGATVSRDGTESDENMVCSNILLSLGGLLEPDAVTEDEGPVSVLCGVRRAGMKRSRSVARQAVYRFLRTVLRDALSDAELQGEDVRDASMARIPPLRDKVPALDGRRLCEHAEDIIAEMGLHGLYWERLVPTVGEYYAGYAAVVWSTLCERDKRTEKTVASCTRDAKEPTTPDYYCPVSYKPYAEVLSDVEFPPGSAEKVAEFVDVVEPSHRSVTGIPKKGLVDVVTVELPDGFGVRAQNDVEEGVHRVVADGRRVVCAVGNFEALSSGYIECLPSKMLADTGATLSLVDSRVLKRLGRSSKTLRPYEGLVKSSSGHPLRIHGWIGLSLRLGTVEITLDVLVADRLHVDAILGVDALGALGAVIDVAERCLTLKGTGEVLPLGFTVVQDAYMAVMAKSVRLPPRGQALVMANVIGGTVDKKTVLVEGAIGLPPTLCVANSLGTVEEGQVIVEICNASTDECWVRRGTPVACAAVIPESAFEPQVTDTASGGLGTVEKNGLGRSSSVTEEREETTGEKERKSRPDVPPDKREFDLFSDHQALTWVFSPGNRTTNAMLARWAMELSNLEFKVHHKPGTLMGHVDGLSRLFTDTVAALAIRDLLKWGRASVFSRGAVRNGCWVRYCWDSMDEPVGDDGLPSSVGELNGADGDRVIDAKRMELLMEFMEWCYWALNAGLPLLWRAVRSHWTGLLWVLAGVLAWMITKPMWGVLGRLCWTVFCFG